MEWRSVGNYQGILAKYDNSRLKSSVMSFSGRAFDGNRSIGPPLMSRPPSVRPMIIQLME